MNQDQARRWAEKMELPEPFNGAHHLFTENQVREAIAAALVKLTQQEPTWWIDGDFPSTPCLFKPKEQP